MITPLKMFMSGGGGSGRFKVLKRQLRPSFIKVIKLRVLAKNPHNMVTLAGNIYLFPSRIFTFLTYHIHKVYHASIQLGWGIRGPDHPGKSQSYRFP